jgi:hypothetical protein
VTFCREQSPYTSYDCKAVYLFSALTESSTLLAPRMHRAVFGTALDDQGECSLCSNADRCQERSFIVAVSFHLSMPISSPVSLKGDLE